MRRPVIALAIAVVAGGVLGAGLVLGVRPADATTTPPTAGQYCTPRGVVYRTATFTLICAQSVSSTRHVDTAYRWRNTTPPACPAGWTRQILHIQAVPRGETTARSVTVLECVSAASSAAVSISTTPISPTTSTVTSPAVVPPAG